MEKMKWDNKIDQWFEDEVWTKYPFKHASPHMFFLIGFLTASIICIILAGIFKIL